MERMPEKNADDDIQKEIVYCKELQAAIESDPTLSLVPSIKEKLNLLKETVEDTKNNFIFSKDTDARTGHKSADSSFFGYKTHIAITEERIITAAVVTSGGIRRWARTSKTSANKSTKWDQTRYYYLRWCILRESKS